MISFSCKSARQISGYFAKTYFAVCSFVKRVVISQSALLALYCSHQSRKVILPLRGSIANFLEISTCFWARNKSASSKLLKRSFILLCGIKPLSIFVFLESYYVTLHVFGESRHHKKKSKTENLPWDYFSSRFFYYHQQNSILLVTLLYRVGTSSQ